MRRLFNRLTGRTEDAPDLSEFYATLGRENVAFLADERARLECAAGGLGDRALRYIVNGDDESVLDDVRRCAPVSGQVLGLKRVQITIPEMKRAGLPHERQDGEVPWMRARAAREAFLTEPITVPDDLLGRLGAVYHEAMQTHDPAARQAHWHRTYGGSVSDEAPWFEALLWACSGASPGVSSSRVRCGLSAERLAKIAVAGDLDADFPVRMYFGETDEPSPHNPACNALRSSAGFGEAVAAAPHVVHDALSADTAERLVHVLNLLRLAKVDPAGFAERAAELTCSGRRTVRTAALRWLGSDGPDLTPHLIRVLREGDAAARANAAERLGQIGSTVAREALSLQADFETSKKVHAVIKDALQRVDAVATDVPLEAPERASLAAPGAPPPELRPRLIALFAKINDERRAQYARMRAWRAEHGQSRPDKPILLDPADIDPLLAQIGAPEPWPNQPTPHVVLGTLGRLDLLPTRIDDPLATPGLSLIHGIRLLFLLGSTRPNFAHIPGRLARAGVLAPTQDLRDVADAVSWAGAGPTLISETLAQWYGDPLMGLDAERVWPFWLDHIGALSDALRGTAPVPDYIRRDVFARAVKITACFPHLPERLRTDLGDAAFDVGKTARALVQPLLKDDPEVTTRVIEALGSRKYGVRAAAAQWLNTLRRPEAIPALEQAARKEKRPATRAALLTALEACGGDVGPFFDRASLLKEAIKGLDTARIRDELAWVARAEWPPVHWDDSGDTVDERIVRWWVVQAALIKEPAPDPLLRRYLALLRPADRAALGLRVLETWIERDTDGEPKPHAYEPIGTSAQNARGVLALVAAGGGPEAARTATRYIRTWYGHRAPQAKTLLRMLAYLDDPVATQSVVAIAQRFRTAGIRKAAAALIDELAAERGWTTDQLGDRTAPDGGFDPRGELPITYHAPGWRPDEPGPVTRTFVARLTPTLDVTIEDTERGKLLKTLPAARDADSGDSVLAAKKACSAAKKTIKDAAKTQAARLYEGMCTERTWTLADWRADIIGHPLLGRLARRVAWSTTAKAPVVFRPQADGTLTDAAGGAVTLPGDAVVRIAHATHMDTDARAAWNTHFDRADVDPLFEQCADPPPALEEHERTARVVTTFRGYALRNFVLRNEAKKRKWVRGESEDGGWFYCYRKSFPSLRLDAVLQFSGSQLPEDDTDIALVGLRFEPLPPDPVPEMFVRDPVIVDTVPAVLLAEIRREWAEIAAKGRGFDPKWVNLPG